MHAFLSLALRLSTVLFLYLISNAQDYAGKGYITFETKPLGSVERPFVLRTFVPTAGVSQDLVLPNHA